MYEALFIVYIFDTAKILSKRKSSRRICRGSFSNVLRVVCVQHHFHFPYREVEEDIVIVGGIILKSAILDIKPEDLRDEVMADVNLAVVCLALRCPIADSVSCSIANEVLGEIRDQLLEKKVRANAIVPLPVVIPAQNTSSLQTLSIPNKGTIEIVNDVHILKPGDKISWRKSWQVLQILAVICLAVSCPTAASVTHSIVDGFENFLLLKLNLTKLLLSRLRKGSQQRSASSPRTDHVLRAGQIQEVMQGSVDNGALLFHSSAQQAVMPNSSSCSSEMGMTGTNSGPFKGRCMGVDWELRITDSHVSRGKRVLSTSAHGQKAAFADVGNNVAKRKGIALRLERVTFLHLMDFAITKNIGSLPLTASKELFDDNVVSWSMQSVTRTKSSEANEPTLMVAIEESTGLIRLCFNRSIMLQPGASSPPSSSAVASASPSPSPPASSPSGLEAAEVFDALEAVLLPTDALDGLLEEVGSVMLHPGYPYCLLVRSKIAQNKLTLCLRTQHWFNLGGACAAFLLQQQPCVETGATGGGGGAGPLGQTQGGLPPSPASAGGRTPKKISKPDSSEGGTSSAGASSAGGSSGGASSGGASSAGGSSGGASSAGGSSAGGSSAGGSSAGGSSAGGSSAGGSSAGGSSAGGSCSGGASSAGGSSSAGVITIGGTFGGGGAAPAAGFADRTNLVGPHMRHSTSHGGLGGPSSSGGPCKALSLMVFMSFVDAEMNLIILSIMVFHASSSSGFLVYCAILDVEGGREQSPNKTDQKGKGLGVRKERSLCFTFQNEKTDYNTRNINAFTDVQAIINKVSMAYLEGRFLFEDLHIMDRQTDRHSYPQERPDDIFWGQDINLDNEAGHEWAEIKLGVPAADSPGTEDGRWRVVKLSQTGRIKLTHLPEKSGTVWSAQR
nr:unnamed protein product [Callosobruchus analis]